MPHLTGLRLAEVRSAINALKERRLPNLGSDLLVAKLYSDLKTAFKEYDHAAKKLQERLEDASEDEEERKVILKEFEALQEQAFEVPAFRQLKKENLPKAFKGERGEANNTSVAGIIIALGDEYFDLTLEGDETPESE